MPLLRFPVLLTQDHDGYYTARTLDGETAAAHHRTQAGALGALKAYLAWSYRHRPQPAPDMDELELKFHRLRVRPEIRTDRAVYPCGEPVPFKIPCIHGRRSDHTRLFVLPDFDVRVAYQDDDPVETLVADLVRRQLSGRTPDELLRHLPPQRISLHSLHVRTEALRGAAGDAMPPTLSSVAEPLGAPALRRRFARAWQREAETNDLVQRLRGGRANLLLLGEAGVGKTTLLVDAVRQVERDKSRREPDPSDPFASQRTTPRRFYWTSGSRLIAGMQYLGQWEERCEQVVREVAEIDGVLCVDNLLELVRLGGREAGDSVGAFLVPYLEHGELRMVAEATPAELDACRRLLPALAAQFQVVPVPSFSPAQAQTLLAHAVAQHQRNLKVAAADGVGGEVYRLFQRFLPYQSFPGRATRFVRELLDEAARHGVSQVAVQDVIGRFRAQTGLPEFLLRDDWTLQHQEVVDKLQSRIFGQPAACEAAAAVVTTFKAGLNDPRRPLGVLLFCGPTGVGKTELAKTLAEYLFGAGDAPSRLVRLDMSEYSGPGAGHRLLTDAHGGPSELLKKVRLQPFVVVLLDEIEKAAPEVFDVLLSVLDEGRLTDRYGRTTSFQSAVILLTSNLGTSGKDSVGFDRTAVPAYEREVLAAFRPEFVNRLDRVVVFDPLSRGAIRDIVVKELGDISGREGLAKARIRLTWSDAVVDRLAEAGFDPRYGARPLQRVIERAVATPLARWLLEHRDARDATVALEWDRGVCRPSLVDNS